MQQSAPESSLAKALERICQTTVQSEAERIEALALAHKLVAHLETPGETLFRMGASEPALWSSLKVLSDLDLFSLWKQQPQEALDTRQLSQLVPCEFTLLERLLRHLAAHSVLIEAEGRTYRQTPLTLALTETPYKEWLNYHYDVPQPCFAALPEYLASNQYTAPTDVSNGVFQLAKNFKGSQFEWFAANPREAATFNEILKIQPNEAPWTELYPSSNVLARDDGTSALIVDIGGGIGHDIEVFRQLHAEHEHRLVLQDLPHVIEGVSDLGRVQKMSYDFFTEQPVKGASIYYLHHILHDWADVDAKRILQNTKTAMTPGRSRILIHDHIIPDQNASSRQTTFDLSMMVMLAARERSEQMWVELLSSVGLRVVNTWRLATSAEGIIEAELEE